MSTPVPDMNGTQSTSPGDKPLNGKIPQESVYSKLMKTLNLLCSQGIIKKCQRCKFVFCYLKFFSIFYIVYYRVGLKNKLRWIFYKMC